MAGSVRTPSLIRPMAAASRGGRDKPCHFLRNHRCDRKSL